MMATAKLESGCSVPLMTAFRQRTIPGAMQTRQYKFRNSSLIKVASLSRFMLYRHMLDKYFLTECSKNVTLPLERLFDSMDDLSLRHAPLSS
jgi:hypothetical protein